MEDEIADIIQSSYNREELYDKLGKNDYQGCFVLKIIVETNKS